MEHSPELRDFPGEKGDDLLPIWHDITKQEVIDYSPSLADKVARSTGQQTVKEIADEIAEMVLPSVE